MFDMGFTEMLLISIVALIVIGPEKLPGVARTAGKYFTRLKRFMTDVKADVESELRADELRDILKEQQKELDSLKNAVSDVGKDIEKNIESTIDTVSDDQLEQPYKPPADDNDATASPAADLQETAPVQEKNA